MNSFKSNGNMELKPLILCNQTRLDNLVQETSRLRTLRLQSDFSQKFVAHTEPYDDNKLSKV